jgi:hypothetical protein
LPFAEVLAETMDLVSATEAPTMCHEETRERSSKDGAKENDTQVSDNTMKLLNLHWTDYFSLLVI